MSDVFVHLCGRMHEQHSFPALPVQTLRGDESSCQPPSQTFPDQETRYEAVRPSVLNGVPPPTPPCAAELTEKFPHGKQVSVGPTESSLKLEAEPWRRVGAQRRTEVSTGLFPLSVEHPSVPG